MADNSCDDFAALITISDLEGLPSHNNRPFKLLSLPKSLALSNNSDTLDSLSPNNSSTSTSDSISDAHPDLSQPYSESEFRFYESIPGFVPETISCFKTIADRLNIPLKVDVLSCS